MHDPGRAATSSARVFVWTGAALFVVSLTYFLYTFWTVFGRITSGRPSAGAIVWDVALFSVFALHHSVFAREPVRRRLAHAVPHLERSLYVWLASLLFILVSALWQPVGGLVWQLDGAAHIAAVAVQLAGVALSIYSAALIDIWELAGVRQINSQVPSPNFQALPTPNFQFKTTGPYGLVRHPIYLGWFLIVLPVGTMTMTRFVFAVVSCLYVVVALHFEERSLRHASNGAYDRYMKQVPRKLIPGLY